MSEQQTTPYSSRVAVLADLWMNYRNVIEFVDFIEHNDVGLPLAYVIDSQIVESSPMAEKYINETWNALLATLKIEDTGFETFDDMLDVEEF